MQVKYPSNASILAANGTHTATIRAFIAQGATKAEILDAYVLARIGEVKDGSLLQIRTVKEGKMVFVKRPMNTKDEQDTAASLLRKHGNTHYKNADSEMSASAIQAKIDKAAKAVATNTARVAASQARLADAKAVQAATKKAS